MANVFDQFDVPKGQGNIFDQFDASQAKPQAPQGNADHVSFPEVVTNTAFGGLPQKAASGLIGLIQGGAIDPIMGRGFNVPARYNEALAQVRGDQAAYEEKYPTTSTVAKVAGLGLGVGMLPGIGTGVKGTLATGGVYGGLLGATDDANSLKDRALNTVYGAGSGAAMGGLLGVAAKGVGKVISPYTVPAENAAAADILKKNGVDLTAGQTTGNKGLLYRESEMGGHAAQDFMDTQGQQFTQAILGKIGENAKAATPEVMQRAYDRIGGQFDALAARSSAPNDGQLSRDVLDTLNGYTSKTADSNRVPYIRDVAKDILKRDIIHGDWYKNVRSELGKFAKGADPQTADAAYSLQNALDAAMERSNPDLASQWKQARSQYRNLLVVERAATGAGENAAKGYISPAQLRQATVSGQGRRNYAKGKGDFADLARAGVQMMTPLPNSGTAGRLAARILPNIIGGIAGGTYGNEKGGLLGALGGAAAGAAGPALLGRMILSPMGRAYLTNQLAGNAASQAAPRLAPMGGLLGYDAVRALSQ